MTEIYLSYSDGKPVIGAPFYEAIGGRVRQARKTRNLTQKDLSQITGISIQKIRTFEKHAVPPSGKELLLLCHHLDITPNWIYYGTDSIKHAKHIQSNLVNAEGYVDSTDEIVRLSMFFSVLTPEERRAIEIILTSMIRGSQRSDEDIQRLIATSKSLTTAFSNNPFLNNIINALAADPELIERIEKAMARANPEI